MAAKFLKIVRGRRLVKLLFLLAVVTIVYLSFQLLTVRILSSHPNVDDETEEDIHRHWHQQQQNNHHVVDDLDPNSIHKRQQIEDSHDVDNNMNIPEALTTRFNSKEKNSNAFKNKENSKEQHLDKQDDHYVDIKKTVHQQTLTPAEDMHVPRGVLKKHAHLYNPDRYNHFICISSKESIPYERLNDDYCDCKDSSDEPGTSACQTGRFYCKFQLGDAPAKWVTSSKVNDGVCDCCDGSDEWKNQPLDEHVKLDDNKKYGGLYQAPCHDRCAEVRAEDEAIHHMMSEGQKLKLKYVQDARDVHNPNQIYGKDGAFAVLRDSCYHLPTAQYTYIVCPYKSATQKFTSYRSVNIGHKPVWASQTPGKYQLKLTNGDNSGCPGGVSRTTVINFICGLTDTIKNVQEDDKCVYKFLFSTPAAC